MKQNGKKMVANMSWSQKIRMVPVLLVISLVVLANISLAAEQKSPVQKSKIPPLLVTTAEVNEGAIQAMAEFVGTTYFVRVSHVATDIEGLVRKTDFAEGHKVKKGEPLVQLDSELLDSEITGARAAFEQNLVDLENARRDFNRIDSLYKDGSISETDHDSYRSQQMRLEKLSIILDSKHNNLLITKRKKSISAPFSGIVIQKSVEVGEWVAKGGNIALIADNSNIDVRVDVPIEILENLEKGKEVRIRIGSREYSGKFSTFIPRGDNATRTFTAKFSLENSDGIVEGLEALVSLPKGGQSAGLLVPRDAIVDKYGKTMVFLAVDSKAKEVLVEVAGYVGLQAVITGPGLEKGQQIIVKGSKRVDDGMSLQFRN
ncbi:MAG: efflux RND transporter periplasmic adaptor subunit [Desulfobacterales bacterium]|nr:efflux RND transporter periplasmic adaptor subunit [Desulfobacterales bacterium]